MKQTIITPLSEFPTEVLVYNFKRLRVCSTHTEIGVQIGVEKRWSDVINDFYELPIYSTKKVNDTSGVYSDDTLWFKFEGLYWKGGINELKKELDKRPHCNINCAKDFRKWKINWKKQNNYERKTKI